jgi:hypothetical protein
MEGLVLHAPMTDVLRERGVFDRHPFVLIDVGCAGGIAETWRAFGSSLVAHGYDPDVTACEEAQAREPFPNVRYHARFVGLPETNPSVQRRRSDAGQWPNTNIWDRVTAGYLAAKRQDAAAGEPAAAAPLADPSAIIESRRSSASSGFRPSISSRWTWMDRTSKCSSPRATCWPTGKCSASR